VSGKPLSGMLVEMIPMRRHGGMTFSTRTDSDGRYRISGHQTDGTYITTVYPPADSGYLGAKDQHQGWPAGARFLEVNFGLERGRLVSGRVIDQSSKQPISGAAVVYQAARKNPNNTENYDLRNSVLTDKEGRFKITALPGEGILAVEVPDNSYMRSPLKGTSRGVLVYPHGHLAIDVPKDGTPSPVEIALRKGVTLEAKVVGPDGQIVKDVTAMYPGQLQRDLAERYRLRSAAAWLDAMAGLLSGATISSESKDGLLALVRSEPDPARLHGRILTRMPSLPEGQVG
jgi:hypothetical protein